MPKEKPGHHKGFDFTEHEQLFERVSYERLLAILEQADTTIHEVAPSSNNYGEFLFVSLSKQNDPFRGYITFWGLGYHDQRERWLTHEWFWFRSTARSSLLDKSIPLAEAKAIVAQRKRDIETWSADTEPQSERGQLFETVADLTDEDGAYTELQDLEASGGGIFPEATSSEPAADTEAAHLRQVKDGIMAAWRELPPEHKATMLLVLIKELQDEYYRWWLLDAIDELFRQE